MDSSSLNHIYKEAINYSNRLSESKTELISEKTRYLSDLGKQILNSDTSANERIHLLANIRASVFNINTTEEGRQKAGDLFESLIKNIDNEIKYEVRELSDDEETVRALCLINPHQFYELIVEKGKDYYLSLIHKILDKGVDSHFPLIPLARTLTTLNLFRIYDSNLDEKLNQLVTSLNESQIEEFGPKWMEDILEIGPDPYTVKVYQKLLLHKIPSDLQHPTHQGIILSVLQETHSADDMFYLLLNKNAIPFNAVIDSLPLNQVSSHRNREIAEAIQNHYGTETLESLEQYLNNTEQVHVLFLKLNENSARDNVEVVKPILDELVNILGQNERVIPNLSSLFPGIEQHFHSTQTMFKPIIEVWKSYQEKEALINLGKTDIESFAKKVGELDLQKSNEFVHYLIYNNEFDLHARIHYSRFKKFTTNSDITTRFQTAVLLEKTPFSDKEELYLGTTHNYALYIMADFLNKSVEHRPDNLTGPEEKTYDYVLNHFVPQLLEAVNLSYFVSAISPMKTQQRESFLKDHLERISNLEAGSSILVPMQTKSHAMGLQIERRPDGNFKITQYNTGAGLSIFHPQWDKTDRYQTYLTMDHVPHKNLANLETWNTLFFTLRENENPTKGIEFYYETLFHSLCKGGIQIPASVDREDYEACQFSSSCGYQWIMTALRKQIMQLPTGTKAEKLALYKKVKARFLIPIAKENMLFIDEVVREISSTKIRKLEADLQLAHQAASPSDFDRMQTILNRYLMEIGEDELAETLKIPPETDLGRYSLVRKINNRIIDLWRENPEMKEKADPDVKKELHYSIVSLEYLEFKINQLLNELDRLYDKDLLSDTASFIWKAGKNNRLTSTGQEWLIEKMINFWTKNTIKKFQIVEFLINLSVIENNWKLINNITSNLKTKGHEDLVKFLKLIKKCVKSMYIQQHQLADKEEFDKTISRIRAYLKQVKAHDLLNQLNHIAHYDQLRNQIFRELEDIWAENNDLLKEIKDLDPHLKDDLAPWLHEYEIRTLLGII